MPILLPRRHRHLPLLPLPDPFLQSQAIRETPVPTDPHAKRLALTSTLKLTATPEIGGCEPVVVGREGGGLVARVSECG